MNFLDPPVNGDVYVISDLHLGGRAPRTIMVGADKEERPDYRMCTERGQALLADFLNCLCTAARRDPQRTIHLIINGDFIDFLAEDDESGKFLSFMDQEAAYKHLDRIIKNPEDESGCRKIFLKLREFLLYSNTHLSIILGNHDIELAWLKCQDRIKAAIAQNDSHVKFYTDGNPLIIGQLWIEHGNRFDSWNKVNYTQLKKHTEDPHEKFFPAYGSELVTEVINDLKKNYPFVDLLKPETRTVVPLLYHLEAENRSKLLTKVAAIWLGLNHLRQRFLPLPASQPRGGLSRGKTSGVSAELIYAERFNREDYDGDALFRQILDEELATPFYDRTSDEDSMQQGQTGRLEDMMGGLSLLLGKRVDLKGYPSKPPEQRCIDAEAVRKAISYLLTEAEDRLHLNVEKRKIHNRLFENLLNREDNVIVTGHTHVLKFVRSGTNLYINTGTWADVMVFPAIDAKVPITPDSEFDLFLKAVSTKHEAQLVNYRKLVPGYAFIRFDKKIIKTRELRIHRGSSNIFLTVDPTKHESLEKLIAELESPPPQAPPSGSAS